IYGCSSFNSNFAQSPVTLVVEKKFANGVIGNHNVNAAIMVEVGDGDPQPFAFEFGEAGLLRDIGEMTFAIVVIQDRRDAVENVRAAIAATARQMLSAVGVVIKRPVQVAGDD